MVCVVEKRGCLLFEMVVVRGDDCGGIFGGGVGGRRRSRFEMLRGVRVSGFLMQEKLALSCWNVNHAGKSPCKCGHRKVSEPD